MVESSCYLAIVKTVELNMMKVCSKMMPDCLSGKQNSLKNWNVKITGKDHAVQFFIWQELSITDEFFQNSQPSILL